MSQQKEMPALRQDARWEIIRAKAQAHWKEHNPKYYRQIRDKGQLNQRLDEAADKTVSSLQELEKQKLNPDQQREIAYQNWQYPSEK